MKIVVLDGFALNPGDLTWDKLQSLGDVAVYDRTGPDQVIGRSKDAMVIFTNKVLITREIMSFLPGLRYIGVLATGYNVVDTVAAREAGIVVTNIPAYGTASVAQIVFAHILHFVNNVAVHAQSVRDGEWTRSIDFCYQLTPQTELEAKTLGIIGFGRIGQAVAGIGNAFGMKIIFYDPAEKKDLPGYVRQVDLDHLFSRSDFISINCPLTNENKDLIRTETLSRMKPSAFLVNTGRGPLINENDLAEALNSGRIAGAGLDVLSAEPPVADNLLLNARNCTITPHIAWATKEARIRLMDIAVSNLKAFLGGNPVNTVN